MTKRIIRIDINAASPLAGKTTLAAVIARAIKDQFPDQPVEVLSQETDFLIRAQDLAQGHAKLQADLVQIVDINANPQPLREGALFSTIIADIQTLPEEQTVKRTAIESYSLAEAYKGSETAARFGDTNHEPLTTAEYEARRAQLRQSVHNRYESQVPAGTVDDPLNYPERPLALVSLVTEAVTKAVKADLGPAAQADANALLEIILNDSKFRQAAEEFECDRGDQYVSIETGVRSLYAKGSDPELIPDARNDAEQNR
jgi:hypothetical protein